MPTLVAGYPTMCDSIWYVKVGSFHLDLGMGKAELFEIEMAVANL